MYNKSDYSNVRNTFDDTPLENIELSSESEDETSEHSNDSAANTTTDDDEGNNNETEPEEMVKCLKMIGYTSVFMHSCFIKRKIGFK